MSGSWDVATIPRPRRVRLTNTYRKTQQMTSAIMVNSAARWMVMDLTDQARSHSQSVERDCLLGVREARHASVEQADES